VDRPNRDEVPIESTEASIRSAARSLPKGVAQDAIPIKVIDVPECLLGERMRKDRYDWKDKRIIELGNPNYKGAFATTREKDPEGKWRVVGLELHIFDTGEENPPALPKEHHLKEKVTNPTKNINQTTEEASAPAANNCIGTTTPKEGSNGCGVTLSSGLESLAHQRSSSSALAPQQRVCLETTTEHTRECNSAHQPTPPFHDSTTFPAIEVSTPVTQSKQRVSNRKKFLPSLHFASIAPPGSSAEAHLPRTVAPMRLPRSSIHLEERVLLSADILTPTSHTPAPHSINTEPEPEPVHAPISDSLPEWVLPQPSPRTTNLAEPTQPLLGVQFDSSFCSGSNAVESLSGIAKGFLRRYVCAALPFVLLNRPKILRVFGEQ
jgi:hypothetical protein